MGRRISILSTDAEILQIVPEEGFVEYLPFQISCFLIVDRCVGRTVLIVKVNGTIK